jgi:hypothetical protein
MESEKTIKAILKYVLETRRELDFGWERTQEIDELYDLVRALRKQVHRYEDLRERGYPTDEELKRAEKDLRRLYEITRGEARSYFGIYGDMGSDEPWPLRGPALPSALSARRKDS